MYYRGPTSQGLGQAHGYKVGVRTSVDNPMTMDGKVFFDTYPTKNAAPLRYGEHETGPSANATHS